MCSISPPREGWREFDDAAARLAAAFWPGPLTLVLPKTLHCPVAELATAGLEHHRRARAEPSGRARTARGIRQADRRAVGQSLGPRVADHRTACAGRSRRPGRSDHRWRRRRRSASRSTIVACLGGEPRIAAPWWRVARRDRPRARPRASGSDRRYNAGSDEAPLAPGMLASHYAPKARVAAATRRSSSRAKPCSRSAHDARRRSAVRAVLNLSRTRRSRRSGGQPVCPSARARPRARRPSP